MASQKVLIVTEGCSACEQLTQALKRDGLFDKVTIVNASTPEGLDFAKRLGVRSAPECAVVEERDGETSVRVCSQSEWVRLLKQGE